MKRLIVLALTLVPFVATAQAGDDEWVEATGEAAVLNDNEVAAKDNAKDQALRLAVEMAAGTIVTGISESKDFMAVRDEVTSQGAGFVRKFEIKSSACAGGVCKVTVRALVAKTLLQNRLSALGLMVQKRNYPRVLLLISEQNADAPSPSYWWGGNGGRSQIVENELVRFLNKEFVDTQECRKSKSSREECWKDLEPGYQFRFVDYASVSSHPSVQKAAGAELTDAQVRQIAQLTDAEVAIVGSALAKTAGTLDTGNDIPLYSIQASISLRAIDVSTGQVIATASTRQVGARVSQAIGGNSLLQLAAREVTKPLKSEIAKTWAAEDSGVRWVRLEISGIKSYGDLMDLKTLLQGSVAGVKSVQQRKMEDDSALLELQCTTNTEQLAAALSTPLKHRNGDITLRVTKVTPGVVAVTVSR